MGSYLGALKSAASRVGLSLDEYQAKMDAGMKWCGGCRDWHPTSMFGPDRDRPDGLRSRCRTTLLWRNVPSSDRDKTKANARRAIAKRVARGQIPHPNNVPCVDCGDVWTPGKSRHEYDHAWGYDEVNRWRVEAVCNQCHKDRERSRRKVPA